MLFSRSEIVAAIPKLTGMVLSYHVAKELGWQPKTFQYLKRNGYLTDKRPRYVDPAELAEFQKQFVSMTEMRSWKGARSTIKIRRILDAKGIPPEIPIQDGGITSFWPRLAAKRALQC